ncbi:MAG: hypothetical protein EPO21_00740 [Chloroflexota bacterium]|nr:MAG: hypothetical protein EPO21_00740 [Chloroflexota bacterium]
MSGLISKREELEAHFKRYPDVPREVILKSDMLRLGVFFTEPVTQLTEGCRTKLYGGNVFAHDIVTPDEMPRVFRVPEFIELRGGLYGLRGRLRVHSRVNTKTPYVVDVVDGAVRLCLREGERKEPIADLWPFRPEPKFWSKKFEDGTPYKELSWAEPHPIVFLMCQHWGPKEECKFCEINYTWNMTHQHGVGTLKKPYTDPQQVAEVIAEIFREERAPEDKPYGVLIDGGTITKQVAGLTENEFYLRYVEAIREKIGPTWPICVMSHPQTKEGAKRWRDAGATKQCANIEVWDKRLFGTICPGKERHIGWDNWVKRMLDEVEVFGWGNVEATFVAGVEMAQPWGFTEVRDAVRSTTSGMEYLMSHGIVPMMVVWAFYAGAALKDQVRPPLEYYVEIARNWYELLCKYRLPGPTYGVWAPRMGPGRFEMVSSAVGDMGDEPLPSQSYD